ncbi:MAG: RtcB family protein [Gammaproteobacteria bacterium]
MLQRLDPYRVRIHTPGMDTMLFASEKVPIDTRSVDEIVAFAAINDTIEQLRSAHYLDACAAIRRCVLTPDFHRGAGIPIGTVLDCRGLVIPKAIGSDIGCGMRLLVTDVASEEFRHLDTHFDDLLRHIFFEGGRGIALSARQRLRIFLDGIQGLLDEHHHSDGIWRYWDQAQQETDVMKTHLLGRVRADSVFGHEEYLYGSGSDFTYDAQIGSIGGGNHFVEIQRIDEIYDAGTALAWGLKKGVLTVMVHTGSVSIGHTVGNYFSDLAKSNYPERLKNPKNGFFVLPDDAAGTRYLDAMANAANFAAANRLFLGLMVRRSLSEGLRREIEFKLVHDAPHNMVWREGSSLLHRKGACPAYGPSDDADFPSGHPVIIPGSMGSSSYVLRGHGLESSLCSACHGAGRLAPRQQGRKRATTELEKLRIVTKLNPKNLRRDIAVEHQKALMEEAPSMYKDVAPVIDTITAAGMANLVARMRPLLTIKGI